MSSDSTSSKALRRVGYLASVDLKLVIFSLFLCSSAVCSSPDAKALKAPA
jgi:hypothetical protein